MYARPTGTRHLLLAAMLAVAAIAVLIALASHAEASHFRGGTMYATPEPGGGGLNARVHAIVYFRNSYGANGVPPQVGWGPVQLGAIVPGTLLGAICFGDSTPCDSDYLARIIQVNTVDDWYGAEAWDLDATPGLLHTYPSAGPWTYSWGGSARIVTASNPFCACMDYHYNNPGTSYQLQGQVTLPANQPFNNVFPPIIYCPNGPATYDCWIPVPLNPARDSSYNLVWSTATQTGSGWSWYNPGPCGGPCGSPAAAVILSNNTIYWNTFGASTSPPPDHPYYSAQIQLTGTGDNNTGRSPIEFLISLNPSLLPPPTPPPPLDCATSGRTVQTNQGITFTASGGSGSYSWSAPGGSPSSGSGSSFFVSYNVAGTYTVTLTDSSNEGDTCDVTVVDPPLSCSPATMNLMVGVTGRFSASGGNGNYAWNAPGGSPASGSAANFGTSYATSGSFVVTVSSGPQAATCAVNVPAPPPTPTFTMTVGAGCESWTAQFSDTTVTSGTQAPITSWYWEFGDGATSTARNPSHIYRQTGTYTVTLLISDSNGLSSRASALLRVAASECTSGTDPPQEGRRAPGAPRDGTEAGLANLDSDNDGVKDAVDNCVKVANDSQSDLDGDGRGDACDSDRDGDGVLDALDNCVDIANPAQADLDHDGLGNACDDDRDNDSIPDAMDNCPDTPNLAQIDANGDLVGDACQAAAAQGVKAPQRGQPAGRGAAPVGGAFVNAQGGGYSWVILLAAGVLGSVVILVAALRRRDE